MPDPDWVRVRSGPARALEGRVVGSSGLRRFAANVLARGGPRGDRRRAAGGRPARGPRAPRLTVAPTRRRRAPAPASASPGEFGYPRDRCPVPRGPSASSTTRDAAETRALGARLAAAARPGDLAVPRRRPRRGQDAAREGVRGGPRGHRHRELADVRADGRVRGPAAAVPPRPVPARRRRRRARGRAARRAPARGRRARSSGRSGWARRCRWARLDVVIDGHGRRAARDRAAHRRPGVRPLPGGRRVTAGGPLLAIDTATTRAGDRARRRPTARCSRRATGSRATATARSSSRASRACSATEGVALDATSAGSSSGPGPGAFTGLRVGHRDRQGRWPTRSRCRSWASRPARRCSRRPRRPGALPSCSSRPARRTAS